MKRLTGEGRKWVREMIMIGWIGFLGILFSDE